MPTFEDFLIKISSWTGDHYPVSITTPMNTHASGQFRPPFEIDQFGVVLRHVGNTVRGSHQTRALRETDTALQIEDIGKELFHRLFVDDVLQQFSDSLSRIDDRNARENADYILRIKLQIDPTDASLSSLASLPWERLFREKTGDYLSRKCSLVRHLEVQTPADVLPFALPLRILFISANPKKDLNLEAELTGLKTKLQDAPDIEIDFLENASYADLEERLYKEDYHILHYLGHGDFDENEGVLLLEDGPARAVDVADLLRNEAKTRLVFLNACDTARLSDKGDQDPFAGMAAAMVKAGIPAVVAMQFPITNAAAIAFSLRFYEDLAVGNPVESAVRAGRMKIKGVRRDSMEWATPVLFMQAAAANLFSVKKTVAAREVKETSNRIEDVRLQPYMVDRAHVLDQLTIAIKLQKQKKQAPLFCIVHGNETQCPVDFRDRLKDVELRSRLNLDERRDVLQAYRLRLPENCSNKDELHLLLTSRLGEAVLGFADAEHEDICEHLSPVSAVMIHSTIYSTEWDTYPDTLIQHYTDYWTPWPNASQRVLVFLEIIYKEDKNRGGWFGSNKAKKLEKKILKKLETLNPEQFSGVVFRILPRLGDVKLGDVKRWAEDYGHRELLPSIESLYDGLDAIQMEELTKALKQLIARKLTHETTGTHELSHV